MSSFVYKAKKITFKNGKTKEQIVKGNIVATSIDDAGETLVKNGYEIIDLKKTFFDFSNNYKLTQKEIISFFSSMASMDKVGVSVLQALALMKNDVADSKNLKKVCEMLYFDVSNGMQLSEACEKSSVSFTHDIVGLVKIAEETGKFYDIFTEIVEYVKWNFDTKTKAKKAIRGPLATIGFMIAMIVAMSVIVLPNVVDFIKSFDTEIPIYTQILIDFANLVKTKWHLLFSIFGLTYLLIKLLSFSSYTFKVRLDYLKLKIPIFGNLLLKIDTSRFITFFSIMYKNNSDILGIIDGVSKIVANRYFGERILAVKQRIADGETIFEAINKEKSFPVMFRKMMSICETTGEVGPVLENVRYFYDTEVKDTTEKVVGLIKPMTTIAMGVMVAWMGLAMLGPVYSNIANIGDISSNSSSY